MPVILRHGNNPGLGRFTQPVLDALAFLIELVGLHGRARLAGEQVHASLQY